MAEQKKGTVKASIKNFLKDKLIYIAIGIILTPLLFQGLLYIGIAHIPIIDYKLESVSPRIEAFSPQNLETLDSNTIALTAILSDEGGADIDWENSHMQLFKGNEEIQLTRLAITENRLNFEATLLDPGQYSLLITAQDRAKNTTSEISTFLVKEKPAIKLNVIADTAPKVDINTSFARVWIQNVGELPLIDFEASYKFHCTTSDEDFQWVERKTTVLFQEGDKMELTLPADLNIGCSAKAQNNSKVYRGLESNKFYLVPEDKNYPVCLWCETTLRIRAYQGGFRDDFDFLYPYFEGNINLAMEKVAGEDYETVDSEELIPEAYAWAFGPLTLYDIGTLCRQHKESPSYCWEISE